MGCGASKALDKRLAEQDDKLKQLMEKNQGLQDQIQELKEQRNKRKPIYIINDQEIEDLNIFKTDLDRRFATLQQHIEQLNLDIKDLSQHGSQLKISKASEGFSPPINDLNEEDKWKKMIENNNYDFTIKPLEIDEISGIQVEEEPIAAGSKNILDELGDGENIPDRQLDEEEKINLAELPQPPPTRQRRPEEIDQSVKNLLQDEQIKKVYQGVKNKIYGDQEAPKTVQPQKEKSVDPPPQTKSQEQFFQKGAAKSSKGRPSQSRAGTKRLTKS